MTAEREPPAELVALLREGEAGATPGPDCPAAATLWVAASGYAEARAVRALVAHTAACASCSNDWRFALELAREAGLGSVAAPQHRRGRVAWATVAAVLALLGLAYLAVPWTTERGGRPEAEYRHDGGREAILPGVADDAQLARDEFLLSWSEGPPGTTYRVEVMTEDLRTVSVASGLDAARVLVPPEELATVPSGARLLWRVESTFPDGRVERSPSFVVRVSGAP